MALDVGLILLAMDEALILGVVLFLMSLTGLAAWYILRGKGL